jgi:FHS family L-fucose permease-like MFS transporter
VLRPPRAQDDPLSILVTIAAFLFMAGAATLEGGAAIWSLILVGLGHSIMFPAVFALGIKGLGPLTEEGSGLLITAIAGGALVVVHGCLADTVNCRTRSG